MPDSDPFHTIPLASETDLAGWRGAARTALQLGIPPERLRWEVAGRAASLDLEPTVPLPGPPADGGRAVRIAKTMLAEINTALLHSDPDRFALAYRLVHRAQDEPALFGNPADADVARVKALAKNVRRDIHKMHAFVRFRKAGEADGRERFVAWFEPEHHIVEAVAPFFRNRFTGMDWTIVTPQRSIRWDGAQLFYGPGGSKADVPDHDAVEAEWRGYYASIFNPARVKTDAMKAEMPVKYWKNLPEAELIPELIGAAGGRVSRMTAPAAADSAPAPDAPEGDLPASLAALYAALAAADDLPRENFSERLVVGEGPSGARIMFVGEQPGDMEDQHGRPFIGPAGQLFDRALGAAGIDRSASFVTNAVKRFKFVPRGPRRIHQKPSNDDIEHYRWWLLVERRIVAPRVTVALGATAARALTGQTVTISRTRGEIRPFGETGGLLITVHPSFLLRLPDEAAQRIEYERFVRDLKLAREAASA